MSFDFCGIGNACIDIVSCVDDAFLSRWDFPKSICTYLELEPANRLEAELPSPQYIPGGCGANTAAVIIALGGAASFLGCIADDALGHRLIEDMKEAKIAFTGKPDNSPGAGSTRIFALITPDTERTFAAYYGVQENLSPNDLDEDFIKNSTFMYLDGYALNSRRGGETFLQAAEISHKAGKRVVLSPSDLSILRKHPDVIKALTAASDGIVCNLAEALYITGEDTAIRAAAELSKIFSFGAVTVGEKGVIAFEDARISSVPAAKLPAPIKDTNGAGDAFAGGFLYGLSKNMGLERAATIGNRCAATIITHTGARPTSDYRGFLSDL